uniref:Putative secreted protein n=1 Tax=Ixodes ricinus TaxID=34613 RepID=A0A6B0U0J2_IXORI
MAASQNGTFGIRSVLIAAWAMAASVSAPASQIPWGTMLATTGTLTLQKVWTNVANSLGHLNNIMTIVLHCKYVFMMIFTACSMYFLEIN